ncbi:Ras-related GTP-binding protein A-like Protein [Paramicrosporidium saccamoebae]|uniref:GTP-binding protein n=1 Tax=Paramicrosporidium saccamoebae TaxID=1246581 RepID=A0A2H9TL81_9FUNG|nr:Ras-related GTP-binding protein A-like Protein [Paramicrosporidium saccamoebae]
MGSQDKFMDEYLNSQSSELFSNVAVLVYAFDVTSESTEGMSQFDGCMSALRTYSPEAKLFVLFHKSDLLSGSPSTLLRDRESDLKRRALPTLAHCHITSIWDESLYRAWSSIISSLVPNLTLFHSELLRFVDRTRGEEAILFEAVTLLAIGHVTKRHHPDGRRFEKISNMMKQLRTMTGKFSAGMVSLRVVLGDGTGLLMERLCNEAILMLTVPHVTPQRMLELPAEVAGFKPVFTAVSEAQPEVDPHML